MAKKVASKNSEPAPVEVVDTIVLTNDGDPAVEKRLVALYTLQCVDTEIDKIQIVRGELPRAIEDLEDEIEGLNTRVDNLMASIKETEKAMATRKNEIAEHQDAIATYKEQQKNVRNSREYESLNKEIEYKELEIQLCERKNKEGNARLNELQMHIDAAKDLLAQRTEDLELKRKELDDIIQDTQKDEDRLKEKSVEQQKNIEDRYLTAYKRIRRAARNGLAVVQVEREACGGCFAKIPPQRKTEIRLHKKVIVCEHCGRILVDDFIAAKAQEQLEK